MPHEVFEPLPRKLKIRVLAQNVTDRQKSRSVFALLSTSVAHSFVEEHFAREVLQIRPGRVRRFEAYSAPGLATPLMELQTFSMAIAMPDNSPISSRFVRLYLDGSVDRTIHEAAAVARIPDEDEETKILVGMDVLRTLHWFYEPLSPTRASFSLTKPNFDQ